MSSIGQYLKDTRIELRHVAWPTRMQTIIYTVIVIAISLAFAAYLGLFDFLFTSGLTAFVNNVQTAPAATVQATTTPITVSTSTFTTSTSTAK